VKLTSLFLVKKKAPMPVFDIGAYKIDLFSS